MLVDKNAQHAKRPIDLEPYIFFGQVQNIFIIKLGPSPMLELTKRTTLILAAIHTCVEPQMRGKKWCLILFTRGPLRGSGHGVHAVPDGAGEGW